MKHAYYKFPDAERIREGLSAIKHPIAEEYLYEHVIRLAGQTHGADDVGMIYASAVLECFMEMQTRELDILAPENKLPHEEILRALIEEESDAIQVAKEVIESLAQFSRRGEAIKKHLS